FRYQYYRSSREVRNYQSTDSYYTRDLINRFSQIEDNIVSYVVPLGGILDRSKNDLTGHSLRGQLNFHYNVNPKHEIIAFVGAEISNNETFSGSNRTYGYDADYLTYQTVDFTRRYPIYSGLSGNTFIPNGIGFGGRLDRAISLYINGNYIFKNRYVISGNARRDATNLFGVETNNKWKPLWSLGGAWEFSKEPFYNF